MNYSSNTANKALMTQARESLNGNWGIAIITYIISTAIMVGIQFIPILGSIIGLLISGAISIGLAIFALSLSRDENAQIAQIFDGFPKFLVGLGTYILICIFIILWSLLLIIPGIIAGFRYSQVWFILSEDEGIGAMDAISKSKEMMVGNKWKLFCLYCRFIGWGILCVFTLGVGVIVLYPYVGVSVAKFYDDLKKENSDENMKAVTAEAVIDDASKEENLDGSLGNNDEGEDENKEES